MKKKGILNKLGLVSRANLIEIEEKIDLHEIDNEKRITKLINLIENQNAKHTNSLEIIGKTLKKIDNQMNHLKSELDEIYKKVDNNYDKMMSFLNDKADHDTIEMHFLRKVMDENNGLLKSTDWKVAESLITYKQDLESIVNRIDNMDPIVNMEKIENLLKMLVVNNMMDYLEDEILGEDENFNTLING